MPKIRPPAPSRHLPADVVDLEKQRIVKRTVTLLDEVEQAYLSIYNKPEFKKYREALENDECLEGSIFADDIMAAQQIRAEGEALGLRQIEEANLTVLSQKLRAAESRFNASRKQRARASEDVTPPSSSATGTDGTRIY